MVALGTQFNAQSVAPYEQAGAVWEGRVPVVIVKTEIKPTAANDGQHFLALHVKALDAPYTNQENVIRLNLYNKNAQAVDIAQRQLSSICHVTGKMQVTDADQLLNTPFISVWTKGSREITDQSSGMKRNIETCECRDWQFADGRTIKEAMAGQSASNPYTPGQSGGPQLGMSQPQAGAMPQMAPQPQPGFAMGNAPGAASAPQGGFAPPPAQAPVGAQQPQPQPGFGTAPSPSSSFAPPPAGAPQAQSGFAPPAGPQAGPGPWGGAAPGGPAPGGFGPR